MKRGQQVAQGIAYGNTYKEIAGELGISKRTVATYRERAAKKLGIRARAGLVRWALKHNILD